MKPKPFALLALAAALAAASCGGPFDLSTWFVSAIMTDKPAYDGRNGDEPIRTNVIERSKFQSPEDTDVILELPAGLNEQADRWDVPGALTLHAYSKARTPRWLDSRKARFTFTAGAYTIAYDENGSTGGAAPASQTRPTGFP